MCGMQINNFAYELVNQVSLQKSTNIFHPLHYDSNNCVFGSKNILAISKVIGIISKKKTIQALIEINIFIKTTIGKDV